VVSIYNLSFIIFHVFPAKKNNQRADSSRRRGTPGARCLGFGEWALLQPVSTTHHTPLSRDYLHILQDWVQIQFEKQPTYRQAYLGKPFQNGDLVAVGDRRYTLSLNLKDRATSTAKLIGDTICLELNENLNSWQRTRTAKTLLSRIVAKDFQAEISQRVEEINAQTFRQPIKSVNLKYNHSNWGSCSRTGNVNLSTRLLFAPRSVQDYVILHELAHLVEMNHSDRFWALVERYMPNYTEAEKWLKINRSKCDF
jgi:predicted metal-dependent hydrolase